MDIFKYLENLNVSEGCFDDIIGLMEEYINERDFKTRPQAAKNSIKNREEAVRNAYRTFSNALQQDKKGREQLDVNYTDFKDGKVQHVTGFDEDDKIIRNSVPASDDVQKANQNLQKAEQRLSHAQDVANQTVGDSLRHEEEHKEKIKKSQGV